MRLCLLPNGTVIAIGENPHEIPYIPPDTGIVTRSGEELLTMCLKLSQKRILRLVRRIGTLGHPRSAVNEFRLECEQWWTQQPQENLVKLKGDSNDAE